MRGDKIYYWDTCLFLAWLNDEVRKSGEMDGVREVIERHKHRDVKIMTSSLTQVEVLNSKLPTGLADMFANFMRRINQASLDNKIAKLAHDIRDHYAIKAKITGKKLTTPDAIHLATAIFYRVDEFHTFDSDGDSKTLGLLPLSGDVAGHRLLICKPTAHAPQLDFTKPRH
ncbi:MAG: type II toxin-antitoxin system VapC family toxin [Alphaproteobacteria bacterium]|nr:type II toxin-antitoxin system VapC family toxin [Alphaproteobacteria bacterium]